MQSAIIASKEDVAGMSIKDSLLKLFNFKKNNETFENNEIYELEDNNEIKLCTIDSELIHSENIDKKINADLFIFASKHRAQSGINALTCHPIGNFSKAEIGGKGGKLCIAPASLLKNALIELNKHGEELKHEVTLEATHHGPYLEKPTFFMELGSQESNWNNKEAANIIAKTITNILNNKKEYKSTVVLGGIHYNYIANKVMLKSNYAVGHICPKHNLESLDDDMLKQLIEKTLPKPEFVLLDWKGLGKEKQRILELLKNNNIKFERSDKFFK